MISLLQIILSPILMVLASGQILNKVSVCMQGCINCPLYEPSKCLKIESLEPCQNGYVFQPVSQRCLLRSDLQSNYMRLEYPEERKTSIEQPQQSSWKQGKVSECSYIDESDTKKFISVVGMFRWIYSISKEFDISDHHETYLFSFNLIRSSWMPHNDFLIVDMEAGNQLLGSYEITYDNKNGFQDYSFIQCNGQQVVTQKFNIKINLNKFRTATKIKVNFTGFLFTSMWGITNIKFIPGCEKFTGLNRVTGNCDLCDAGYFRVALPNQLANSNDISRCSRCPVECRTCNTATNCSACVKGYRLSAKNTCIAIDDYVQVSLRNFVNATQRFCNAMNDFYFPNDEKLQVYTRNYTNPANSPFGIIFFNFDLFYNTKVVLNSAVIEVLVNNVKIDKIDAKLNLTNLGYEGCQSDSLERWSVQKFSFVLTNIPNVFNLTLRLISQNCLNCKFGFSNINLFHIRLTALDPSQLQKIGIFSSQKEAVQNIEISNEQMETIAGLTASAMAFTHQNTAYIPQYSEKQSAELKGVFQTSTSAEAPQIQLESTQSVPMKAAIIEDKSVSTPIIQDQQPEPTKTPTTDTQSTPFQTQTIQTADTQTSTTLTTQTTAISPTTITITTNNTQTTNQIKPAQKNDIKSKQSVNEESKPSLDHMAFSVNGENGIVIRMDTKQFPALLDGSLVVIELKSTLKSDINGQNVGLLLKPVESREAFPLLLSEVSNNNEYKIFAFHTDKTYLNDVATIYSVNQNSKTKLIDFNLTRADYLDVDSQKVTQGFNHFFSVFAWTFLILVFIAILSGKAYLVEESIQSLQMVFLVVYIYTSYLPASIVNTISGLRRLENFDFFVPGQMEFFEKFFLGDLIQEGPLKFSLFHKDINFIRGMIPLIFLLIIIGIWFLAVSLLSMKMKKNSGSGKELISDNNVLKPDSVSNSLPVVKQTTETVFSITSNKLDYWMQVFKLMFLPVIFLSFKQFNNFSYPEKNSGSVFKMIFCLIFLIGFVLASIILTLYIARKYFKLEYKSFIRSFPSVYYKKIPTSYLPTENHRIVYPLIRYFKIFMFCLLTAILGDYTIIIFVFMTLIFAGELFYARLNEVYQDSLHLKFLLVESVLTVVLLFIQMVISQISAKIETSRYLVFGYVHMSICIVIMLNGLGRIGYLITNYLSQKGKKGEVTLIGSEKVV